MALPLTGDLTREKLNQIYNEFIDAYNDVVEVTKNFIPSVFFIYSEKDRPDLEAISYPVDLEALKDPNRIDSVLEATVKSFPTARFTLEMILYANEGINEINGERVGIFGARDSVGNTIHTALGQNETAINIKLELKDIGDSPLHKWLPPTRKGKKLPDGSNPINDALLDLIATRYMVAASMVQIFPITHNGPKI